MQPTLCRTVLKNNWPYVLLVVLVFAAGLLAGIWSATGLQHEQVGELETYIEGMFTHPIGYETDSATVLRTSTSHNAMLFAAIYIAGLSVIGIPLMLGLLFVRGFALGFAVSLLVGNRGWDGAALVTAALLPQNMIFVPAIIIAASASFSFSVLLIRRGFNPQISIGVNLARYTIILAASLAIAAGASLVEAYLSPYMFEAVSSLLGA